MIFLWGKQPERLKAFSYFLIYRLLGSIPLFVKVLRSNFQKNIVFFLDIFSQNKLQGFSAWVSLFWVLAFLVKLPVFGLHI
jgi:NADH:ubiquinone oxidoreductase subunit 4 (subunit M)